MGQLDDGISNNAVDDDATAAYDAFTTHQTPLTTHFVKYPNTYIRGMEHLEREPKN
jgi:hypothetical protein